MKVEKSTHCFKEYFVFSRNFRVNHICTNKIGYLKKSDIIFRLYTVRVVRKSVGI